MLQKLLLKVSVSYLYLNIQVDRIVKLQKMNEMLLYISTFSMQRFPFLRIIRHTYMTQLIHCFLPCFSYNKILIVIVPTAHKQG